jgi:NADPH-dependent curcumin reductase CurA
VLISKDRSGKIKAGDYVTAYSGWQLYANFPAEKTRKIDPKRISPSQALGALGMPGRAAYFGLLEIGKPKPGECVVVSGAAGAVGSLVCQIAKIKGCHVVAFAGSDDKIKMLKSEFKVDEALNYHNYKDACDIQRALEEACPNKAVDIYFDNTGGPITDAAMELLNVRARVVICGQISQYSGGLDQPAMGPRFLHKLLYTRGIIQGVLSWDYEDRTDEMIDDISTWISQGKLKIKETVWEGFDNVPRALNALFHGENVGKLVVKVADE